MNVLVWSIALLGLAFGLHLAVWRIRLPARQTRALLTVFFGVLVAGLAALGAAGVMAPRWAPYLPAWPAQLLHVGLFFVSVTLAYMITYSALEADSPSLVMIQAIADAGDDGLDERRFDQAMTDAGARPSPRSPRLARRREVPHHRQGAAAGPYIPPAPGPARGREGRLTTCPTTCCTR